MTKNRCKDCDKVLTKNNWRLSRIGNVISNCKSCFCNEISIRNSGRKHTKETRKKISKSLTGRKGIKHTEETKEKLRKINIGRKHTKESIKKIGLSSKGRKQSKETREKRRKAHLGKKRTKESVEKTRLANIGRKHTEESKHKQRKAALKRISKNYCNGEPVIPNIGTFEKQILDKISNDKKITLLRNHRYFNLFPDGYDEHNNIIYEVDEPRHERPAVKKKDQIRQNYLMNKLKCSFVRIKIDKLGNILQQIHIPFKPQIVSSL